MPTNTEKPTWEPWVACDLDGTIAEEMPEFNPLAIGAPIPAMVAKVKAAIKAGKTVKIFTARLADKKLHDKIQKVIAAWTKKHIGQALDSTNEKDPGCMEIWDNIAQGVEDGEFKTATPHDQDANSDGPVGFFEPVENPHSIQPLRASVEVEESPRFKAWFKGSKVVDTQGNPKVVYHGTGSDISSFSYEFAGQGNDQLGSGFYFTDSVDTASGYTSRRIHDEPKPGGEQANIMPVYLCIKKPIHVKAYEEAKEPNLTPSQVRRVIGASPNLDEALTNFGDVSYEGKNTILNSAVEAYSVGGLMHQLNSISNDFFSHNVKEFNDIVHKVTGYDGIISEQSESETHYVAWFPTQIKSAIGNVGKFDKKNPSITAHAKVTAFQPPKDNAKIYKVLDWEYWRDPKTRLWWATQHDAEGNQIGDALNAYTKEELNMQMAFVKYPEVYGDQIRRRVKHASTNKISISITQSPQFQTWFSGSKVVNPDGTPMVMYHATQSDIGEFRPFTHFGTQAAANQRYSDTTGFYNDVIKNTKRSEGSNILPVYLSIKNPLRLPDLASIDLNGDPMMYEDDEDFDPSDREERQFARGWESEEALAMTCLELGIFNIDEYEKTYYNDEAVKLLKEKGYDGIVYKNAIEDAGNDSWIAFRPDQVKSAVGNSGGFDPNSPNITAGVKIADNPTQDQDYDDSNTQTPAFKAWFGKSKIVDDHSRPLRVFHGTDADFDTFDRAATKSGPSKFGFWFAKDKDFAEMFGNKQMATYLKMENPYRISSSRWNDIRDRHHKDTEWFEQWRDKLIASGYDGLIVEGEKFTTSSGLSMDDPTVYAVFQPNQIKSANNSGTFNTNNHKITASGDALTESPEFKVWFGNSEAVNDEGLPLRVFHGTKYDFDTFTGDYSPHFLGFWFSCDPKVAEEYAGKATGSHIKPVYLKIIHPIRSWSEFCDYRIYAIEHNIEPVPYLQSLGFDGVIFGGTYIVFSSNQIKSAIGNIGEFSKEDASITASKRVDNKHHWRENKTAITTPNTPNHHVNKSASTIGPVYHGTTYDFDEFKRNKGLRSGFLGMTLETDVFAYFFTKSKQQAIAYAKNRQLHTKQPCRLITAYLTINHLLDLTNSDWINTPITTPPLPLHKIEEDSAESDSEYIYEEHADELNKATGLLDYLVNYLLVDDMTGEEWGELGIDDGRYNGEKREPLLEDGFKAYDLFDNKKVTDALRYLGFDGAKVPEGDDSEFGGESYCVLTSNQIKVTSNIAIGGKVGEATVGKVSGLSNPLFKKSLQKVGSPRIWYHGTTTQRLNKIMKSGYLEPKLADNEDYGKAIWFTTDIEEAKECGNKILCISHQDLIQFKHKNIGTRNKWLKTLPRKERELYYTMLVFEPIPVKYIKIMDTLKVGVEKDEGKFKTAKTAAYTAYVLTDASRNALLKTFPPKFPDVIAHHVTFQFGVSKDTPAPTPAVVKVEGYCSDESLEALVVSVDGETTRPDGGTYHITLSLDRAAGRKPMDSNGVIKENEWTPIEHPFDIKVVAQKIANKVASTYPQYASDVEIQEMIRGLHQGHDFEDWDRIDSDTYKLTTVTLDSINDTMMEQGDMSSPTELTVSEGEKLGLKLKEDIPNPEYETVNEYAKLTTPFPPIVLNEDGDIIDGFHRAWAAKLRGDTTIQAYVPVDKGNRVTASMDSTVQVWNEAKPNIDFNKDDGTLEVGSYQVDWELWGPGCMFESIRRGLIPWEGDLDEFEDDFMWLDEYDRNQLYEKELRRRIKAGALSGKVIGYGWEPLEDSVRGFTDVGYVILKSEGTKIASPSSTIPAIDLSVGDKIQGGFVIVRTYRDGDEIVAIGKKMGEIQRFDLSDEVKVNRKGKVATKTASPDITLYRGEGPGATRHGRFWSPNPEFARQFTRQGLESELLIARIPAKEIYKAMNLPYGGDFDEIDAVVEIAKAKGYNALWCSEGGNEPDSVYVFNPLHLHWLRRRKYAATIGPVYHGTSKDFQDFELTKGTRTFFGLAQIEVKSGAFFFTDDPNKARNWAEDRRDNFHDPLYVWECYLTMNQTLDLRDPSWVEQEVPYVLLPFKDTPREAGPEGSGEILSVLRDLTEGQLNEGDWHEMGIDINSLEVFNSDWLFLMLDSPEVVSALKYLKYDSIIMNEGEDSEFGGISYAVFNKDQIKKVKRRKVATNKVTSPISALLDWRHPIEGLTTTLQALAEADPDSTETLLKLIKALLGVSEDQIPQDKPVRIRWVAPDTFDAEALHWKGEGVVEHTDEIAKAMQQGERFIPAIFFQGVWADGNHRVKAGKKLGLNLVPAIDMRAFLPYVDEAKEDAMKEERMRKQKKEDAAFAEEFSKEFEADKTAAEVASDDDIYEAAIQARKKALSGEKPTEGYCEPTSDALYDILNEGGYDVSIAYGNYNGVPHTWVQVGGTYIDPTHDQFKNPPIRMGKVTDFDFKKDYEINELRCYAAKKSTEKTSAETMTLEPEIEKQESKEPTDHLEEYLKLTPIKRVEFCKKLTPKELKQLGTQIAHNRDQQLDTPTKVTPPSTKPKTKKKLPTHTPPIKNKSFKSWFGKSKVIDSKGNPLVVYHGTTHDFDTFNTEGGNVGGWYGKGMYFTSSKTDTENYAGVGPDLTNRIENKAEDIANEWMMEGKEEPKWGTPEYEEWYNKAKEEAKKALVGEHGGFVMPCYLKIEHPVIVSRKGGTVFEFNYDEETGEESGSGMLLYEAVQTLSNIDSEELWASIMEVIGGEYFTAYEFDKAVRNSSGVLENEGGWGGSILPEIYQNAGFDGIIMKDVSKEFPKMNMDKDTTHYIVFESNQIKSAIGNVGKFDTKSPSITASVTEELGFTDEDISAEDSSFVGTSSPGVRIEAHLDSQLVGVIEIYFKGTGAYVRGITVVPQYQCQGIGQALYNRAIALASERGYEGFYSDKANCMSESAQKTWNRLKEKHNVEFEPGEGGYDSTGRKKINLKPPVKTGSSITADFETLNPKYAASKTAKVYDVYHGTDKKFKTFDDKFKGTGYGTAPINMMGFNFTDSVEAARTFGTNVLHAKVRMDKPCVINLNGEDYSNGKHIINRRLEKMDKTKYDGIILKNYADAGRYGDYVLSNHYIPFSTSQIQMVDAKTADRHATPDEIEYADRVLDPDQLGKMIQERLNMTEEEEAKEDFLEFEREHLNKEYPDLAMTASSTNSLFDTLYQERGNIATVAQKVYDNWNGGDGICFDISYAIREYLNDKYNFTVDAINDKEYLHAWVVCRSKKERYFIDIPFGYYEKWVKDCEFKKVPNVTFTANHVRIYSLPSGVRKDNPQHHPWMVDKKYKPSSKNKYFWPYTSSNSNRTAASNNILYHVTPTANVPNIMEKGLQRFQPSNWEVAKSKKRYGQGEIYAMTNEMDAIRWAARMDWEFNKSTGSGKISIVRLKQGKEKWEVDNNDPLSQIMTKGQWLKCEMPIPALQIVDSFPVTREQVQQLMKMGASKIQEELPPAPGTLPIPPMTVRLYHYTKSYDNLPSIKAKGLLGSMGRGDGGTGADEASAGVWASTRMPDNNKLFVEFYASPDQISHRAQYPEKGWRKDSNSNLMIHDVPITQAELNEWASGYKDVIIEGDIPPNQFLAIHEPWHHHARYMLELTDKEWEEAIWLHDPEEINKLEQCGDVNSAKALAYVQKLKGISKTAKKYVGPYAFYIEVPKSARDHFWTPVPEGNWEFWGFRSRPRVLKGEKVIFTFDKKPVAETVCAFVEKPGESKCTTTGKYEKHYKLFWDPKDFKKYKQIDKQ